MLIDEATVLKIAALARVKVPQSDLAPLAGELSNILGWVEQLAQVDTEGVPPMTSVVEMDLPRRGDVVTDGNCRDKVLANAPETVQGFYTVPKVVE